jgi:hypothetical protein
MCVLQNYQEYVCMYVNSPSICLVCRCPPAVCLQDGNTTCVSGHEGPLCSLCIPGYAMQSGQCRDCGSLGVWPQLVTALLAFVVLLFLLYFSWFPLLPLWLQAMVSFARDSMTDTAEEEAEDVEAIEFVTESGTARASTYSTCANTLVNIFHMYHLLTRTTCRTAS